MGVVWRARDETLGEEVALKFLPDAVRWDPAAFDDLKAETRRARQLTHPNIVRIHDFVEDMGGAAISMELVKGQTLTQLRLATPARILEVADIAPWLPQLGAALDYAHTQARVVHRDLKPSNLMLTETGVLKVADFGVARGLADSVTRVSMMAAGTLVYMSPQQAMGDEPRPADDVYALGATLYELLTGKPPFHTGDVRTQLFQRKPDSIASRRRAWLSGVGRGNGEPANGGAACGDATNGAGASGIASGGEIPTAWEKTIAACLAKDPAARPATLGEVAAKLVANEGRCAGAAVRGVDGWWRCAAVENSSGSGSLACLVLGLGMAGLGLVAGSVARGGAVAHALQAGAGDAADFTGDV
jgi:serine/threonine protein kinase